MTGNDSIKEGCRLCPRKCMVLRQEGHIGYCGSPGTVMVARAAPHYWEEPCISGKKGSGAVFFTGCNLHCCYCQNKAISDGGTGKTVSIERLSEIFLELQGKKVYNINLVTPTHYADSIKKAVRLAKSRGLRIPVVYNCSGYESVETLKDLQDIVDIWLPDFKYISKSTAGKYSGCPDYPETAVKAIDEMVRQVKGKGGTVFKREEEGDFEIMLQGVIVRHMLLPGLTGESKRALRLLHERYGDDILISIMSQYTPMPHIMEDNRFPELKTKVLREEYDRLVDFALKIGIENAFVQEGDVAEDSFIPLFDCTGVEKSV